MKVVRFARNVFLVALAFRLIVRRRKALARERRARRIAPLLITAGGAGVILAVRPRVLQGARRLWNATRNQLNGDASNVVSEPPPRALDDTESTRPPPASSITTGLHRYSPPNDRRLLLHAGVGRGSATRSCSSLRLH